MPDNVDPLAARQQQRDQKLAEVHTPQQRLKVLEDIARDLQQEALVLAKQSRNQDLKVVARFYREVVGDNVMESAHKLSKAEREAGLRPILLLLGNLESDIQRARGEAPHSTVDSLDEMLVATRDSQERLSHLVKQVALGLSPKAMSTDQLLPYSLKKPSAAQS